jgi:hypothetical protein
MIDTIKRSQKLAKLVTTQKSSYADSFLSMLVAVSKSGELSNPVASVAAHAISEFENHSAKWWQTCLSIVDKSTAHEPSVSFRSVAFDQTPREFFRIERIDADETIPETGNVELESGEARGQMSRYGVDQPTNLSLISYAALAWFRSHEYLALKVGVTNAMKWSVVYKVGREYYRLSFDHTVFKADHKQLEKYLKG